MKLRATIIWQLVGPGKSNRTPSCGKPKHPVKTVKKWRDRFEENWFSHLNVRKHGDHLVI